MSSAEHLIENAIFADFRDENLDEVLDEPHNKMMLEETGIRKDDLIRMAYHVIYSLYDGVNPFSQEWETGRQIAHTAKELGLDTMYYIDTGDGPEDK